MSKILVTGGSGFIGSHLVDRLVSYDNDVFVVDDLSRGNSKYLNKRAEFIKLDINSSQFIKLVGKIKPEFVFHLAAQSSVGESFKNPDKDFQTNLIATINLLKTIKNLKVKKIIFTSSAAVFAAGQKLPISENGSKKPISTYGLSKLCSEYFFENYCVKDKLPYAVLRFANVYGPLQDSSSEGGVVAIFTNKIINKEPLTIFGDGRQTRDFIYVSDIVDALVKALDKSAIGTFNIGTSIETSIKQIADKLINIYNQNHTEIIYKLQEFVEVKNSSLTFQKFKKATEFEPQVELTLGLKKTLDYFVQASTK